MRVTDQQIFDLAQLRIMRARSDNAHAGDQVSTGKRIEHVWDGSAAAGMIARHEQEASRQKAISDVASRTSEEVGAADNAFSQVLTSLTRARELATQLSNDTYNAQDRATGAVEVQQLVTSVVSQLNVRFGNRFLFGGSRDATPPFDAAGNYTGDTLVRQVEVAPGLLHDASIRADQAFKGVGGGVDVLTELQNLATALTTNNVAGIRTGVQQMATGIEQVSAFRSRAGAMMNIFDAAADTARVNKDAAIDGRSKFEDIDVFEATTNYAATQRGLEAAMSATAQSFKLTLLDKL